MLSVPAVAARPATWRVRSSALAALMLGGAAALGCGDASAAVLGGLATSAGLFATLLSVVAVRAWPVGAPAAALSAAVALALAAAGAARWRGRASVPVASVLAAPWAAVARGAGPNADHAALLAELRLQFVRLQAAWDLGETQVLRELTTPPMLADLCAELASRGGAGADNRTDVVTLHAELLGYDELAGAELASVQFSGLIRESTERGAVPFRELWLLARSNDDGSGWKLARQQALL